MRNIKKITLCAFALSGMAYAEVEASVTAGAHSRYIFRGLDFAIDSNPEGGLSTGNQLIDFGIDVGGSSDFGVDWYAGLWYGSTTNDSDYNETDIYFGLTKDFGFGTADIGLVTYTYDDDKANDSEIYLGLSTEFAGLSLGSTTSVGTGGLWENGVYQEFTLGYGFDVSSNASGALDLSAGLLFGNAGYASDVDGFGTLSATLSVEVAFSEDITLSPYVQYVFNTDDFEDAADDAGSVTRDGFLAGASVSFAF